MRTSPKECIEVTETAAWWLHRLQHDPSPQAQAEFVAWIRKAPLHLEEFLFAQAVWRELDNIDPTLRAQYENDAGAESVVDFPAQRAPSPPDVTPTPLKLGASAWRSRVLGGVVAAGVLTVVVIAVVLLSWISLDETTYQTRIGEQRAIKLADGSVMHLNTRTRAVVHYTRGLREIELREGEALFTVERDTSRPFVVTTDDARVRALGTEFNVYRRPEGDTQVSVIDGAVQVTSPERPAVSSPNIALITSKERAEVIRLARGDEVRVSRGHVRRAETPDVHRAVAWRSRELVFFGRPVAEIVAEFNRYNKEQIRVEGSLLQEHRVSGVFAADDSSPFLRFLAKEPGVHVTRENGTVVIQETR